MITNSVFELPSFIRKQNNKTLQMFDHNIIQNETEQSEKFFKSMKNWSSLPIEDYSIISKINKKLCNAVELRKISKSADGILFKNKNEFNKWKKKFEKQTIPITKRIKLYD